jgi:hypothetical protein
LSEPEFEGYSAVSNVKTVLQIDEDDATFNEELEGCIASVDALIDKLLEHRYPAFRNSLNCPVSSNDSFLNQFSLHEKTQVFAEDGTVDVRFVHDMRQLQGSVMTQNRKNVNVHFKFGPSHIQHALSFQASQSTGPFLTRSVCFQRQ